MILMKVKLFESLCIFSYGLLGVGKASLLLDRYSWTPGLTSEHDESQLCCIILYLPVWTRLVFESFLKATQRISMNSIMTIGFSNFYRQLV